MSKPDRAEQILAAKERGSRGRRFLSYELGGLQREWANTRDKDGCVPDFYVIRAVTLLEVFTRRNVAELIDHSSQFADRAIELSKNFKMDFSLVQSVQGRVITLGDIVGHNVPLNSFGQIVAHFEILLGKPLRPLLSSAVDRWATEMEKRPSEPIIPDFDGVASRLVCMFEVRNILCHELPKKPAYATNEIDDFLDAAFRFTKAMEEVLTFERFGLVPLTQTEMNIAAGDSLRKAEAEMNHLLSEAQLHAKKFDDAYPSHSGDSWLGSLNNAQEKWLACRNALCDFETYLNQGGTIRPLLWAIEAERLTKVRIDDLHSWLEREREK